MPVDSAAVVDGSLQLYTEELGGEPVDPGVQRVRFLTGELLAAERLAGRPLWRSHFASCPDGREWSGSSRRQLDLFSRS